MLTAEFPSALRVQPEQLPDALPRTPAEIKPPLVPSEPKHPTTQSPTTVFLTIDTEDSYFTQPILMTGEGIGRQFGVFGILDVLDAHGMKATFFVNVYEKDRQPPGVVERVVREIAERGHEVGLHTHPSSTLDFYRQPLFRMTLEEQGRVLEWGASHIAKWTGRRPISFRAGGYALNDDTFSAMEKVGIKADSSCFFPSPNNHNLRQTVNAVARQGETLEIPVTTVLRTGDTGDIASRKLDLDWLSVLELNAALTTLAGCGARFAMFMMHSFSFIEKETRLPSQPPSSRAQFVSQVQHGRYVEVYAPKPHMRESFTRFLDDLAANPAIQVRRLCDSLSDLSIAVNSVQDILPIVAKRVERDDPVTTR